MKGALPAALAAAMPSGVGRGSRPANFMAFPQTRHTLIQRLASGGEESDWREFLRDYWGPVCRFARSRGSLTLEDAEDVASETLEAIVKNNLLARWSANRSAKLRTLICAVVRNVLANRARVASGRDRIVREHAGELDRYLDLSSVDPEAEPSESADAFYAAWADDIVQKAVETLFAEYHATGSGDTFRVLHGRLCEEMSMGEIAVSLRATPSVVESQYRRARTRLAERLEELVRWQTDRYSKVEESESEFVVEWARLGDYLRAQGGLEEAVRRSAAQA
jgi:RNA polymerase sigma factor (sigma-70 family)